MLRLSRSRNIKEIETIINDPGPALGQRVWTAHGVECSTETHRYLGEKYAFHNRITHLRHKSAHPGKWEIILVSEFWQDDRDQTIHSTKWMKLLSGKATDVNAWIKAHRDKVLTIE